MNESGRSVGDAVRFLKLDPSDLVVFHDEIDLAPGKLKVKAGGGNAGHNGLRSISAHLGNDYTRVRIGIGHPGSKDAVSPYVLHDFAKAEAEWLDPLLDDIAAAAGHLAAGDEARFLSEVARRQQPEQQSRSRPSPAEPRGARPTPPPRHPAGERADKRRTALAENLKNWLAGRKGQN
jgi:PTH1 family peptidyl-tRNA hydrolase